MHNKHKYSKILTALFVLGGMIKKEGHFSVLLFIFIKYIIYYILRCFYITLCKL